MSGPFRPAELGGRDGVEPTAAEQADLLATAREIESVAAAVGLGVSDRFVDLVMAAVAAEPLPQPMTAARRAAQRGRPAAVAFALSDAWRTFWSGGRPLAVRLRALPVVLVLVLLVGTAGGLVAAGAFGLLGPSSPTPSLPVGSPAPSITAPGPTPTPEESTEPERSASPEPTEKAEPSDTNGPGDETGPTPTPRPTPTPHGTSQATEK
ncbi:MAG TPA: hypothetical protein VEG29_07390, partial [Candidatus Binatia bacterium]|nr:hypothetical protein [Candidatus Binatia bacterium]